MKKFLILALLAILYSCNDHNESSSENAEVTLQLTGNSIRLAPTRGNSTSDLVAGTAVGVYALQQNCLTASIATTPYANALYTATGTDGAFTSIDPLVLYDGFSYSVSAYAPRKTTVGDGATTVAFDHGVDVLYAPASDVVVNGSTATAALSFKHQMSQVSFNLVSGVGSPDLTEAEMEVSGFAASCTMDLSDGSITPVVGSGAVINQVLVPKCFVPGTLTLAISVKTKDGKTYNGTLNRAFVAGFSYSFTLTLNKTEVQLGVTGTVVDWVTVPSGNVDLEDFK